MNGTSSRLRKRHPDNVGSAKGQNRSSGSLFSCGSVSQTHSHLRIVKELWRCFNPKNDCDGNLSPQSV